MYKIQWKSITAVLPLFMTLSLMAQEPVEVELEKAAVLTVARHYMDGAYECSAEREEIALHPELNKVGVRQLPNGRTLLSRSGMTRLREIVRGLSEMVERMGGKPEVDYTVFLVEEGMACARAVSPHFYDFLQMAKIDGEWKLLNVLWQRPVETGGVISGADSIAIETCARNYIEGYFSANADRMEKALHSELNKVRPVKHRKTGRMFLDKIGSGSLIEATRANNRTVPAEELGIEFRILDAHGDIAMVDLKSSYFYDYLQLARINGEWKIVNVLWKMNPEFVPPGRDG